MKTSMTGRSLVAGVTLHDHGAPFHGVNPANDQSLEPAYVGISSEDVNAVAELAQSAFTRYVNKSGKEKAAFLRAIAANIESVVDDLVECSLQKSRIDRADRPHALKRHAGSE